MHLNRHETTRGQATQGGRADDVQRARLQTRQEFVEIVVAARWRAAGNQVIADMEARGELSAGVMSAVRKALAADGTP